MIVLWIWGLMLIYEDIFFLDCGYIWNLEVCLMYVYIYRYKIVFFLIIFRYIMDYIKCVFL